MTKLYDEMDFQRATQAYLWGIPAVSNQSMQIGFFRDLGAALNDIIVFENFLDTKGLFLTGNTTTLYAIVLVDLVRMARSSLRSRRGRLQAWWMTFGSAP